MESVDAVPAKRRHLVNFFGGVLDLGLYLFYLSLTSSTTVLPVLVDRITGSAAWIGVVGAVAGTGWYLPQLFVAPYISRLPQKKKLVLVTTFSERLPTLFLGLFFLLWPGASPKLMLAAVTGAYLWNSVSGGFGGAAWQEMVGKSIPQRLWGTFFGVGNALGGLLSVFGGYLLHYFLSHYVFPRNFAYIFLVGAVVLFVGFWGLVAISEPVEEVKEPLPPLPQFLKGLPRFLSDRPAFTAFLTGRALGIIGTMGSGFYAVYAIQHFGLSASVVGVYTAIMAGTQALLNPLVGYLGDLKGHKPILLFAMLSEAVSAFVALVTPWAWGFYVVYFAVGLAFTGFMVAGLSLPLEFGHGGERTATISVTNTLNGVFFGIAPLLGGFIAQWVGYGALFLLSTVFAVAGYLVLQFKMSDPRHETA